MNGDFPAGLFIGVALTLLILGQIVPPAPSPIEQVRAAEKLCAANGGAKRFRADGWASNYMRVECLNGAAFEREQIIKAMEATPND